ncbi:hypothetical protein ACGFX4_35910 [Kitasatospora sp. NPDC048365]|uniref:hypothetical protein n=1 Tax=Kitasatospora sp. NPDC048365 TaxID=3364050 RepID=UPI0037109BDB
MSPDHRHAAEPRGKRHAGGPPPDQVDLAFSMQVSAGITRKVPAVASWAPERLDVLAVGLDAAMWHKAWAQRWQPGQSEGEPLGGGFSQPPAVASWGPDRELAGEPVAQVLSDSGTETSTPLDVRAEPIGHGMPGQVCTAAS